MCANPFEEIKRKMSVHIMKEIMRKSPGEETGRRGPLAMQAMTCRQPRAHPFLYST